MVAGFARYALVDGKEAKLLEVVRHAHTHDTVCIFALDDGSHHYLTAPEWDDAAQAFALYASANHLVTSASPATEKMALFRSLFRGRDNMYAHGYLKKDGKIGYSPVCVHERTRRCPRWSKTNPRATCSTCSARSFVPIDNQAIVKHFNGKRDDLRDVMGLYVLLPDCTTWVLIADFDKKGWQRETALYRDTCRKLGLSPAVERSRSGNGAHVWLFFEEPLDAELARSLGFVIITRAMSRAEGMSFSSYDRLFPAQATIAEGGFGNLIALPFQGRAQRNGNSVFVNDEFVAYPDQWRFLSSIKKVSLQRAREITESAVDGTTGELAFTRAPTRRDVAPDDSDLREPSGQATQHHSAGTVAFPTTVNVTKANMLFVDKDGLSSEALNRIRRLAAFGNPQFFKAQAQHRSVRKFSRIIWCGEEDEQHIMLPRGCEDKLVDLVAEYNSTCAFSDRRVCTTPLRADFVGTLRGRQQQAADTLLRHEIGVLSAPPGFGKTVIGAYLIGRLKMRTLVIVPKTALVEQWKERLGQFLRIEDDRPPLLTKSGNPSKRKRPVVGQIGAGKNAPSGLIDITTFQSLTEEDDLGIPRAKDLVTDYELVICDECHHGATPTLELIMKSVSARRVYGLSATPRRSDGLEGIVFMHCGPIRHRVDPKEQAAEQGFKRILQPRFTRIRLADLEEGATFNQVVERLCAHDARNALIVEDTVSAVESGRTPLVITKLREHATELSSRLEEQDVKTFLLTGDGTARERRERMEQLRASSDVRYAIVGTGAFIGEGVDLPQLTALMLASPYSWEGVITQYSGRLHREAEGKDDVVVYDYVDTSVPMLERMYKRRLKTYAKLGYEIVETAETQEPGARIIDADAWCGQLLSDLSQADRCVVISAPYANAKMVKSLVPELQATIGRGVEVRIILRKARSEGARERQARVIEELLGVGCSVEASEKPLTGITLIDHRIAWYGTLPLLAFAKADDCSLHVESAEIVHDLGRELDASLLAT